MNTIGFLFRLTTFGESHGAAIGGVIEGIPAGITLDIDAIHRFLARRRPGQSDLFSGRREEDKVEFLSGIYEGRTMGTPIGFCIRNLDARPDDYEGMNNIFRPSHADYTYTAKYGLRDHRGGGRASARETVARCVAGAIAMQVLNYMGVEITAFTSQIGMIGLSYNYKQYDLSHIDDNAVRCPNPVLAAEMEEYIRAVKADGDTVGGVVTCVIKGVPAGWGEPIYDKLHADLGKAMLGINAAKGFEYGMGFEGATLRGSQVCDIFEEQDGKITTRTNFSGGIQGGISNGQDIYFRVAFKPAPTLLRPMTTINTSGETVVTQVKGRHDPCVVPRVVPVVEAMSAIVLLDHYLRNMSAKV